jgi:3',5'-cyclic AMP phosphodiesterase CpdA/predicted small lipoprotein YifL
MSVKYLRLPLALMLLAPLAGSSCGADNPLLLPARDSADGDQTAGMVLLVRFVHITDTQVVDTLSPARFPGAHEFTLSAWRPWESYSTQILDGIVRTANRIHASGTTVDFVIHTGDTCDNAQSNELRWFLDVMDGREVNPLSGPDDRPLEDRPPTILDPYAAFLPQGLYRSGVHGDLPSIPWYCLIGNHDRFATGLLPIVSLPGGRRVAPLPFFDRPGLLLPTVFDPAGRLAHGNVTPAEPGPPRFFEPPVFVAPNPDRAYFNRNEFIGAMFTTDSEPAGHGFETPDVRGWYRIWPAPGIRLIGLNTSDQPAPLPTGIYEAGCISEEQSDFLRRELASAAEHSEWVIVASHHPSQILEMLHGSALGPEQFRALLNDYPNVILHLTGHLHRNRVADRGGYVEIETCSTLDPPQEARVVEIWRDTADDSLIIRYYMFSHLDDDLPPLGEDPLRRLREQAAQVTANDLATVRLQRTADEVDADASGAPEDRQGWIRLGHR